MSAMMETISGLSSPARAASEVGLLNQRLAGERTIPPEIAETVREIAEAVDQTTISRWETIDPRHAPTVAQVRAFQMRTWAMAVETDHLLEIDFDNAATYGISASALVADDYSHCHALADNLRARSIPGIIVPSAALPGSRNVVLFGARVAAPYKTPPVGPVDIPSSITGENGTPLESLLGQVRMIGAPPSCARRVECGPSVRVPRAELGHRPPGPTIDV